MNFKLFGIEIKIDFSIFIVFAIAFLVGNNTILFVVLFSSLHELGHLISLYLLGGKADKINISFYGIGLKQSSNLALFHEVLFLLSGICVNIFFVIFNIHRKENIALILVNALPIYPLDVGRCFKLFIDSFLPINISYRLFIVVSFFEISAVIVFSIYHKNFNLIMISVYLLIFWIKEVFYD